MSEPLSTVALERAGDCGYLDRECAGMSEGPKPSRLKMSTGQPKAEADLEALRGHRDAILQIARQRKATNIRVFGSLAKGAAHGGSDVDFLVSMDSDATLVDLIGLEQDLEALLGREVDVVTEDEVRPRFQEEVQSTAVRL